MSNFSYFLFEIILLFISTGSLVSYHLIKERAEMMEFSVNVPSKIEKYGNSIIILFFLFGFCSFYFFASKELLLKKEVCCKFLPMIGIYFLFGFFSLKNKGLIICKYVFEFLVLFFTVGFLNLQITLKIQMYMIVSLFLIFKQPNVQKKYKIPVYSQMVTISFTMFLASFFVPEHLKEIIQIGGIVFSTAFVVFPFQKIFQVSIKLNQYFINLVQSIFLAIALYLVSEGNIGASFILLSYPLFEMCFAIFLKIYNFFKRQKVSCFMMDILDLLGCSDFDKGMFVFRRNMLFGGLFIFIMYVPSWQPQVVLLTFILYLKFAVSYVAGPSSTASFRYLFKEMKSDFKKSVLETEQAWNNIKQKKNKDNLR